MENMWKEFCVESGQKVSKSRVLFSPSTLTYLRGTICFAFGIKATSNLSAYLGVPLIHERVTKSMYQLLINKIWSKLSSWKLKTLSKAARTLLMRTTLIVIPTYKMHTTLLLVSKVNEISKLYLFERKTRGTRIAHFMLGKDPQIEEGGRPWYP